MQIILTHEQADFDAIASMLGASMLHREAIAVLPNNINRNVRNFLHLYTNELPFKERDHLSKAPIQFVTLVDTQSLVTIKGLNKNTKYHVIDHHHKKEDFPSNWKYEYVSTGACTTHFVMQFQEQNISLNPIHATLMLLGIYEDTGSLTYANTTSIDAHAVAVLLEHGASLKIATEFLNPPLSAEQRVVFEILLDHLETITEKECHIMLSHASAPDLEDEVSTIAHKIMDLYDPDALFIFVETKEGIRLVARSVTDQIDVAVISRQFNGGGHARAAAALIKRNQHNKTQLEDVFSVFKKELLYYVKPGITVKHIMSKKPLVIHPDTTAAEALQLMQRFGYEGYPVVEKNRIKGLLTRRSVDRAMSHKLNMPASSLMDAGSIFVQPSDTLEKLHQLMADSGWGQIPVVDPESGEIIGIATRTDLLKTLAGKENGAGRHLNLSSQIRAMLPDTHQWLLEQISTMASKMNLPIYLVGGFARDVLLKSSSLDLDFVVEGDAIQLAQALMDKYGGRVVSHKKFGTAKWQTYGIKGIPLNLSKTLTKEQPNRLPDTIDLISARTEYYEKPTALPIIKKSSIKLDLLRRDFTINTMAVRVDGRHFGDLYDYWGGHQDLRKGLVRVLHSLSFIDDPTRMLRAVRFEQRFNFSIEERTLELLTEAKNLLSDVSGDRIRHELDQILAEEKAAKMLDRMKQLGLIEHIHPHFKWTQKLSLELCKFLVDDFPIEWEICSDDKKNTFRIYGAYIILFARSERSELKKLVDRLKFKNHLRQMLFNANELWRNVKTFKKLSPSQITNNLEKFPQLVVFCVYYLTDDEEIRQLLYKYALKWRFVHPQSNGNVLKKMGLTPGPQYREILTNLKNAWLDGKIDSEEQEKIFLQHLIENRIDQ